MINQSECFYKVRLEACHCLAKVRIVMWCVCVCDRFMFQVKERISLHLIQLFGLYLGHFNVSTNKVSISKSFFKLKAYWMHLSTGFVLFMIVCFLVCVFEPLTLKLLSTTGLVIYLLLYTQWSSCKIFSCSIGSHGLCIELDWSYINDWNLQGHVWITVVSAYCKIQRFRKFHCVFCTKGLCNLERLLVLKGL